MQTLTVRDVRLHFGRFIHNHKPSLVLRHGKPVAALVPLPTEGALEDFILANSPRVARWLSEAEHDIAAGRVISLDSYLAKRT